MSRRVRGLGLSPVVASVIHFYSRFNNDRAVCGYISGVRSLNIVAHMIEAASGLVGVSRIAYVGRR